MFALSIKEPRDALWRAASAGKFLSKRKKCKFAMKNSFAGLRELDY
jgi:hypothetical protein